LPKEQPQKTTPKDNSKRQRQKRGAIPAPDFGGDALAVAWSEFLTYREEIKHPITEMSAKKSIAILAGTKDPVAMIERTIVRGWRGLFPDEVQKKQQAQAIVNSAKTYRMNHLGFVEVHQSYGGIASWAATEFATIADYEKAQLEEA